MTAPWQKPAECLGEGKSPFRLNWPLPTFLGWSHFSAWNLLSVASANPSANTLVCFLPASSPSSLPPFPSHHHLLKKFFGGPPSRAHSLDPQVLQATLRACLTFLPLTDALAFVALSECTRHLLSAGPSRFSPLSSAPLLFGQLLRDQVSLTPQAQASPPVVHHRSCRHFALLPASSCKEWFVWLLTTRCPVSTEQGSTVSPALAEDPTPSRRSMYSC